MARAYKLESFDISQDTRATARVRDVARRFITVLDMPASAEGLAFLAVDGGPANLPLYRGYKFDAGAGRVFTDVAVRSAALSGTVTLLCSDPGDVEPFSFAGRAGGGTTGVLDLLTSSTSKGRWVKHPTDPDSFYFGINWDGAAADDAALRSWVLWFIANGGYPDQLKVMHRDAGSAPDALVPIVDILPTGISTLNLHGVAVTVTSAASPYAVGAGDWALIADDTGGNVVLNLAAAPPVGTVHLVKKLSSSTYTVTVNPNGTDTIDGVNAPLVLNVPFQAFSLLRVGAGAWAVMGML